MGFVNEYVPKEDWELFNSFQLINMTSMPIGKKIIAGQNAYWSIDRENKRYLILTGVLGREGVEYYTLIIREKKVEIVANIEGKKIDNVWKDGYRISELYLDYELKDFETEVLSVINEALQSRWGKKEIYVDINNINYRGVR